MFVLLKTKTKKNKEFQVKNNSEMSSDSEKNSTTLLTGVQPNTFSVKRINHLIVFTKSAVNFRAICLAPVTRNILGYSLFCDWSQDDVSFEDIIGRRMFER